MKAQKGAPVAGLVTTGYPHFSSPSRAWSPCHSVLHFQHHHSASTLARVAHRNRLLSQSSQTTERYFKASHPRPDQPTLVRLVPPKEVKYEQMKCFIASEILAPSS
ncbi:Torsin-1A-Interacting Protein 1 [Manis pentadactyla]|nr:Torsin-1A-Interacting Protein 1 [Manis pentadactyla]